MKAKDLYKKIKQKYPDFTPCKAIEVDPPGDTVRDQNRWIQQRFDCNTRPAITMEQLELMEAGFEVNVEIPEDHVPLPDEVVERAIRKANPELTDYGKALYQ